MVVASFAVRPGFRKVLAPTRSPSRTRVVRVARAASVAQPSSFASCPDRPRRSGGGRRPRSSPSRRLRRPGRRRAGPPSSSDCPERRAELHGPYRRGVTMPLTDDGSTRGSSGGTPRNAGPCSSGPRRTPWEVLVAEVMSQQTGIERVGPVWRRFVDLWPTPAGVGRGRGRRSCSPPGPGSATTDGRWLCGRQPERSSRTTVVACRDRSRPWKPCQDRGRTRLEPSRRRGSAYRWRRSM